jgi:hypothetical protein
VNIKIQSWPIKIFNWPDPFLSSKDHQTLIKLEYFLCLFLRLLTITTIRVCKNTLSYHFIIDLGKKFEKHIFPTEIKTIIYTFDSVLTRRRKKNLEIINFWISSLQLNRSSETYFLQRSEVSIFSRFLNSECHLIRVSKNRGM